MVGVSSYRKIHRPRVLATAYTTSSQIMLLIPVTLDKSSISGIGVFSSNPVAKGTVVFTYHSIIDRSYDRQTLEIAPDHALRSLYKYLWQSKILPNTFHVHGDEARFINHKDASEANLECYWVEGALAYSARASRGIKAGEELFWDYLSFDDIDISPGNLFEVIRKRTGIETDVYDDWIEGRIAELPGERK